jgi:hypothetical protein
MPYFGATVYFWYQPDLVPSAGTRIHAIPTGAGDTAVSAQESSIAAPALPLRFAPWDAPYFGEAAVYLIYPSYPAVQAPLPPAAGLGPGTGALSSPPVTAIATSDAASGFEGRVAESSGTGRRSWLARLFGRN